MNRNPLLPVLTALVATSAAAHAQDGADFFASRRVHALRLTMTLAEWNAMLPDQDGRPGGSRGDFPVSRATFQTGGQSLVVGLRYKGNSTYRMSFETQKYPFKVDFNEVVEKQKFAGQGKLSLNPNAADASQIRETVAYALFRRMEVPAPRTTFANLTITVDQATRNFGVYTLVENVDDPLLRRCFGEDDGLLLKPAMIRGLPHYGESWSRYERGYAPKGKASAAQKRALIDFTALVNNADDATFAGQIEKHLDVDEFLRFLAATVVLSNSDSFLSMGQNYYLYRSEKTGRFVFLPWDLNMSFGGFPGGASDPARLSLLHPHSGQNPLIERVLALPKYKAAYLGHVRDAAEKLRALAPEIEALRVALRPSVQAESAQTLAAFDAQFSKTAPSNAVTARRPGPGMGGTPLVPFIARRLQSIEDQLAGKDSGVVPGGFGPGGGPGGPGGPGGFPPGEGR